MEAANVSEKWFVILSKKYIFNKLNFTYIPKNKYFNIFQYNLFGIIHTLTDLNQKCFTINLIYCLKLSIAMLLQKCVRSE